MAREKPDSSISLPNTAPSMNTGKYSFRKPTILSMNRPVNIGATSPGRSAARRPARRPARTGSRCSRDKPRTSGSTSAASTMRNAIRVFPWHPDRCRRDRVSAGAVAAPLYQGTSVDTIVAVLDSRQAGDHAVEGNHASEDPESGDRSRCRVGVEPPSRRTAARATRPPAWLARRGCRCERGRRRHDRAQEQHDRARVDHGHRASPFGEHRKGAGRGERVQRRGHARICRPPVSTACRARCRT